MTGDEQATAAIPVACELVCAVRDGDLTVIADRLDRVAARCEKAGSPQEWFALAVVLASMVPDGVPLPDLLGWLEPGSGQRDAMLGKAHQRAAKRQARGLPLWGPLGALEAEYQERRKVFRAEASRAA